MTLIEPAECGGGSGLVVLPEVVGVEIQNDLNPDSCSVSSKLSIGMLYECSFSIVTLIKSLYCDVWDA